jgi:arylsulfatase A-like enzyme
MKHVGKASLSRTAALFAALLATLVAAACSREPERKPNVLLITVDTLRADRLTCYGYARETTPNLDRLAGEGLRYTHAQAPRAKTTPSIASLLTGLYPHEHGVRDLARPLDPNVALLSQSLRAGGYATGAIVGNWVLGDARAGLARGFDVWCENLPDVNAVPPDGAPERKATSLTDGALAALGLGDAPAAGPERGALDADKPWFLWLHYMDPHGAYDAPAEHRVFASDAPDLIDEQDAREDPLHRHRVAGYNAPAATRTADGRIDAAKVRDLYDAEVRYVDRELGRLFDALRAAGRLDGTLVIVTSDHGESLGEHRYWFEHGLYAYEATCRVPLIVRPPRSASAKAPHPAQVRDLDVSLACLAPSLLRWLELPPIVPVTVFAGPGDARLFDASLELESAPQPVFCEKVERADLAGAVQIKAVRARDWKLLQRYASRKGENGALGAAVLLSEELYDLARDPSETHNLAAAPPPDAPLAALRRELARFIAADRDLANLGEVLRRQREGLERNDPDAERILRALGY